MNNPAYRFKCAVQVFKLFITKLFLFSFYIREMYSRFVCDFELSNVVLLPAFSDIPNNTFDISDDRLPT